MVGGKGAHWNHRLRGAAGPVPLALRAADQCPEMSEYSERHLTGGSLVSALHLFKQQSTCCEDHVSRYLVPGTQGKAVLNLVIQREDPESGPSPGCPAQVTQKATSACFRNAISAQEKAGGWLSVNQKQTGWKAKNQILSPAT